MKVTLRDYQTGGFSDLKSSFGNRKRAPLYVLCTGGGKTPVLAAVAEGAQAKGKRVLICAHRLQLIKQASRKLSDIGVEHGIIAPGFSATRDATQIGSIQTVARRLDKIGEFDLIIIDEAHHSVSPQYMKLIASQPKARILGVTATPERHDGKGLGVHAGGVFDDLVLGPQSAELIEQGYLAPLRVFAPAHIPDLSGVHVRMGEYDSKELASAINKPTITGDAVATYAKRAPGQPMVVFCVDVQHARDVAAAFRAGGWRSTHVDGTMAVADIEKAYAGLENGSVQVLTVCELIGEGVDLPGISVVMLLRMTKSLTNYMQFVGRGLRPVYKIGMPLDTVEQRKDAIAASHKTHCILLDHVGCVMHHGMPDQERVWSLNGRPKKEAAPATKQCPECFCIHAPAPTCPECGHSYVAEIKAAREMEVIAGELAEIDAARLAEIRKTPLTKLLTGRETMAQLCEIEKQKGYKRGWAFHAFRDSQQGRRAHG